MKHQSKNETKPRPLFDEIDRKVIIEFYKESKRRGAWWTWRNENSIVTRYEQIKAFRDFERTCYKNRKQIIATILYLAFVLLILISLFIKIDVLVSGGNLKWWQWATLITSPFWLIRSLIELSKIIYI
jgi:hypothetical protein